MATTIDVLGRSEFTVRAFGIHRGDYRRYICSLTECVLCGDLRRRSDLSTTPIGQEPGELVCKSCIEEHDACSVRDTEPLPFELGYEEV